MKRDETKQTQERIISIILGINWDFTNKKASKKLPTMKKWNGTWDSCVGSS